MQTDFKIRNFCVNLVDTIFKMADDYKDCSRLCKDTESSACDTLGTDSEPCRDEQDQNDVLVKDVKAKSDDKTTVCDTWENKLTEEPSEKKTPGKIN